MNPLFETLPVTCHTKQVTLDSTFVAINGVQQNGIVYIPEALKRGASRIVVEYTAEIPADVIQQCAEKNVTILRVADARKALAELSAQAHNYPAHRLHLIGITGTKGKTTTTFLTEHLLATGGFKTALLSTVKNSIAGVDYATELTTQQPDYIHAFLAECVRQGVTHVVVEVAAQALSLYRVQGILFDVVMFMNFSQEHGEFYETQDAYFAAKASLLDQVKQGGTVLLAGDDKAIAQLTTNEHLVLISDQGEVSESSLQGIYFSNEGALYRCSSLFGKFNIMNARFALAAALQCGVSTELIQQGFKTFARVPGRLDRYPLPNGALGCIDYAHNPSSFTAILSMLREYTDSLIVVFGAGGDRDATKRPLMGAIAAKYADTVIVTSDNPRSEDACCIADDIIAGIAQSDHYKVHTELDRYQAIVKAYSLSSQGSIIALLGKGPDEYQLVKGEKIYFSEREILKNLYQVDITKDWKDERIVVQ